MQKREKILVTGGARSGKSDHALDLAGRGGGRGGRVFIATAEAGDKHMAKRIAAHKKRRGGRFRTIEEPVNIAGVLNSLGEEAEVVIIDCLTIWISNLVMQGMGDRKILAEAKALARSLKNFPGRVILVTNEVGMGIVPENPLARRFRDLAGSTNQIMAGGCDKVVLMSCGIPQKIKGE